MSRPDPALEPTIRDILAQVPPRRDTLPDALDRLNRALGCLPRPAIEAAAQHFGRPLSEVFGIASFYALWCVGEKPPPSISLCDDGPCHAQGSAEVWKALDEAGIPVRRTSCIGHCASGPVAYHPGGICHHLTHENARDILLGGPQPPPPLRDEILGIEVPDRDRALLRNVGHIAPESLEEAVAAGAYRALYRALTQMTPEAVVEEVVRSGL
ncbi:MAG: NAD(P)H-dependent oxidoreductase subunit E, partial [Chloroflexia bacterium]